MERNRAGDLAAIIAAVKFYLEIVAVYACWLTITASSVKIVVKARLYLKVMAERFIELPYGSRTVH